MRSPYYWIAMVGAIANGGCVDLMAALARQNTADAQHHGGEFFLVTDTIILLHAIEIIKVIGLIIF